MDCLLQQKGHKSGFIISHYVNIEDKSLHSNDVPSLRP